MEKSRKVELLAPARDADVGIEAVKHGADAVYIGAPSFSARAAVGCSVDDIGRLVQYAHQYRARVLVALNTLLRDDELEVARRMAWQLYDAGVDALIVQDLGLLSVDMPPMPLHASTQMDTRTPQKAQLLAGLGFRRIVLARELSLAEIRRIRAATDVDLECFVHGALCVGVSGQCYMSQCLAGRSANRGVCAQPCRLPMTAIGDDGRVVARGHLLSLRDMNRSARLEELIEAGVTALKIEGRLKDVAYVKNVTAYYRHRLDDILTRHPEWTASSDGEVTCDFSPRLEASFNRGFTDYYLDGVATVRRRREASPIWNFATPKSIGECVGEVKAVGRDWFAARLDSPLHNGDGLVAISGDWADVAPADIVGFRVNRVDDAQHRLYPLGGVDTVRRLRVGMSLWRNHDHAFVQRLSRPSATRAVAVDMTLEVTSCVARLSGIVPAGEAVVEWTPEDGEISLAERSQLDNYKTQLGKLGATAFVLRTLRVVVDGTDANVAGVTTRFVPSAKLAEMRRQLVARLLVMQHGAMLRQRDVGKLEYRKAAATVDARGVLPGDARSCAMNAGAADMMRLMKMEDVAPAYELLVSGQVPVMLTRHCLRYATGHCPRYSGQKADNQTGSASDWMLQIGDKNFKIKFGCKNDCMSEIFSIFAANYPKT